MTDRDLKALERATFRSATDDGLWDVLIAAVVSMFAVGPLLSETLGDFWSSAVFVPIWLGMYLIVLSVRRRIVIPRVGTVRFGIDRQRRMRRFALVMMVVNAIALVLGVAVAIGVQTDQLDLDGGVGYPLGLGIVSLVGFSAAAYVTSIPRFALYGLMLAVAPLVGEWLWRNDLAAHHGYPIVFGVAAVIIFVTGIARFTALLRSRPLPQHPVTV